MKKFKKQKRKERLAEKMRKHVKRKRGNRITHYPSQLNQIIFEAMHDKKINAHHVEIPIGNVVLCDFCGDDYTNSTETGGFISDNWAACPKCHKGMLNQIKKCNEEHLIEAYCPANMSFAEFVINYRGKDAKIIVDSFSSKD